MATAPPVYSPFLSAASRTAAVNIAFGAVSLLVGTVLCLCGRRAWRITCAISVGLAFELIAAAVMFNVIDAKGFKLQYSAADNDLSTFAIILGAGLFGFVLSRITPRKWYIGWWLGWAVLGPLAGMSVAMTMIMLKSGGNMLFSSMVGRWILIAAFGIIGLFAVSLTKWTGATLACCLIGSWLLALGIDLVLNTNRGASVGLRKLLDRNTLHQEALRPYAPPLSTKLLFGLSWSLALLFFALQWYLYKERWFLQIRPAEQQRNWKHWFCPFLLRSSFTRPSTPVDDQEKMNEATLAEPAQEEVRRSRSLHSRQNSTPDSSASMDADLAERGSLASGSDLRALTRNYRRALEILESDDGHQSVQTSGTIQIPIYYRPSPINLQVAPSPDVQGGNVSPISPGGRNEQRPLLKPSSPSRPAFVRTGPSPPLSPQRTPYGPQSDEVPDLGAARRRADSDRGTSYSIPLTNITSSEYRDRDMHRPPSWTGDLPWHPSMLRGDLDPATLPRHPQDSPPQAAIDAILGHVIPIQPAPFAYAPPPAAPAGPRAPLQVKKPEPSDEFEIVQAEGVAQNGKPNLLISQPFQMPYASRPASREGSPNPLSSLGGGPSRNIPKAQRTPTRERHLFPAEDDLPDHNPAAPEGANLPPIHGHSRFHTSETAIENPARPTRDEHATQFDMSGGEDEDGVGDASSHASYSISHFGKKRRNGRNLVSKWKGKSAQKQATPTESSESEGGDLPLRLITQSDLTPHLQDLPPPARPTIVHNENPVTSNHASLITGTPRSSGMNFFGQDQAPPPLPMPSSELSEATVRPSQEQRRSMELEQLSQRPENAEEHGADAKKVRIFDSGSRRTLRDRLMRRQ